MAAKATSGALAGAGSTVAGSSAITWKSGNVRYIRDSVNGSTANVTGFWVEIKALNTSGVNLASGKTATANFTPTGGALAAVTDGSIDSYVYVAGNGSPAQVTVDLGAGYAVDSISVWHFYDDGRTFHDTKTEVSADNSTWSVIFDSTVSGEYAETIAGRNSVVTGGHVCTGTLSGQGSTVNGSSSSKTTRSATGALTGQTGSVAGAASSKTTRASAGDLVGGISDVTGSASSKTVRAAIGVLTGQVAVINGSVARGVPTHSATGVIVGQDAVIIGAASSQTIRLSSGILTGQNSSISGSVSSETIRTASGALIGQTASVSGSAANGVVNQFISVTIATEYVTPIIDTEYVTPTVATEYALITLETTI